MANTLTIRVGFFNSADLFNPLPKGRRFQKAPKKPRLRQRVKQLVDNLCLY